MVQFNSKYWRKQTFSKSAILNQLQISKRNCQRHPASLLAKKPKTTTRRQHAAYPITLNYQMYLRRLLYSSNQIPTKFLKDSSGPLALPLKNLINLLIKLLTFPHECKISKLKPIFRIGAKD